VSLSILSNEDVMAEFEKLIPSCNFTEEKTLASSRNQLEFVGLGKSRILKYIFAFIETGLYGWTGL